MANEKKRKENRNIDKYLKGAKKYKRNAKEEDIGWSKPILTVGDIRWQ